MKEKPGIRQIATTLQRELLSRFDKVLNPSCALFDPVYVEATLLDPRYRIVLTPDQLEAAKVQLLQDVSFYCPFCSTSYLPKPLCLDTTNKPCHQNNESYAHCTGATASAPHVIVIASFSVACLGAL